jgi:hypothetical protein
MLRSTPVAGIITIFILEINDCKLYSEPHVATPEMRTAAHDHRSHQAFLRRERNIN